MEVQLASWNCRFQWCVHSSLRSDKTNKIRNRLLQHLHIFSVMSNRPLRDGELFEIQIERMVERWSGSIEAGVTLIRQDHCVCTLELRIETAVVEYKRIYHVGDNHKSRPEELDFPNTMTDIDYHTWMLSGSAVMRDGQV